MELGKLGYGPIVSDWSVSNGSRNLRGRQPRYRLIGPVIGQLKTNMANLFDMSDLVSLSNSLGMTVTRDCFNRVLRI